LTRFGGCGIMQRYNENTGKSVYNRRLVPEGSQSHSTPRSVLVYCVKTYLVCAQCLSAQTVITRHFAYLRGTSGELFIMQHYYENTSLASGSNIHQRGNNYCHTGEHTNSPDCGNLAYRLHANSIKTHLLVCFYVF